MLSNLSGLNQDCRPDNPVVAEERVSSCECRCWAVRLQAIVPIECCSCIPTDGISGGFRSISGLTAEVEFWFSDKPMLRSVDNVFEQVPGVVTQAYSYGPKAFGGDEPKGIGSESIGQVKLSNCGELDWLSQIDFAQSRVEIHAGDCCTNLVNDYEPVFIGFIKNVSWTDNEVCFSFGDRKASLLSGVLGNKYLGSGGGEGDANLEGKTKPIVLGQVFNISPILIDATNFVYQVNDGPTSAINAVRDRGVALSYAGDFSPITSATLDPGYYATDLSSGVFILGSPPQGEITADVIGSTPYAQTTADIVRVLLSRFFAPAYTFPDDFDVSSFNALEVAAPWTIGYYINNESDVVGIINKLMSAIGGYWFFRRDGKIAFGAPWQGGSHCWDLKIEDIVSPLKREPNGRPSKIRRVGYQKNWTVQTDLAGAAADPTFHQIQGLEERGTSAAVADGQDITTNSFLAFRDDARQLAAKLVEYYGKQLDYYQMEVLCGALNYRVGDCIKIDISTPCQDNRWGISDGRVFTIISLQENEKSNVVRLRIAG